MRDNAGNVLGPHTVVGRRAQRWLGEQEGFGPAAIVSGVRMRGDGSPYAVVLAYDDPLVEDELVPLTEVMIPAVTDRMRTVGGLAALAELRKTPSIVVADDVAARIAGAVLEAAIEGRPLVRPQDG